MHAKTNKVCKKSCEKTLEIRLLWLGSILSKTRNQNMLACFDMKTKYELRNFDLNKTLKSSNKLSSNNLSSNNLSSNNLILRPTPPLQYINFFYRFQSALNKSIIK